MIHKQEFSNAQREEANRDAKYIFLPDLEDEHDNGKIFTFILLILESRFSLARMDWIIISCIQQNDEQTPFEYLFNAWSRATHMSSNFRSAGYSEANEKSAILKEIKALCIRYAGFSLTTDMSDMFGLASLTVMIMIGADYPRWTLVHI